MMSQQRDFDHGQAGHRHLAGSSIVFDGQPFDQKFDVERIQPDHKAVGHISHIADGSVNFVDGAAFSQAHQSFVGFHFEHDQIAPLGAQHHRRDRCNPHTFLFLALSVDDLKRSLSCVASLPGAEGSSQSAVDGQLDPSNVVQPAQGSTDGLKLSTFPRILLLWRGGWKKNWVQFRGVGLDQRL